MKKYLLLLPIILHLGCQEQINKLPGTQLDKKTDVEIAVLDSVVNLRFSKKLHQFQNLVIKSNNRELDFKQVSDKVVLINTQLFNPGLNKLEISYTENGSGESIFKSFIYSKNIEYHTINSFPHNTSYFTEGFLFDGDGNLIESVGLEGKSKILFYKRQHGKFLVTDSILNESNEFGEGIAIVGDKLVQLLWRNNYLKIYDGKSLRHIKNLEYLNEGWGLCTDGSNLFASDGSSSIHIIDISGNKARIIHSIQVNSLEGAVSNLNELEYVDGLIYANIWQKNHIVAIDPQSGYVLGKLDLSPIVEKEKNRFPKIDVLNGIAHNPLSKSFFVTGKYWGSIYEIKLQDIN